MPRRSRKAVDGGMPDGAAKPLRAGEEGVGETCAAQNASLCNRTGGSRKTGRSVGVKPRAGWSGRMEKVRNAAGMDAHGSAHGRSAGR